MIAPRPTLALLGAVLALLVAETLARLHGDRLCLESTGVVYQADARFGWSHVPGMSGWAGTCRTPRVPFAPVDADSHGLLGPERSYDKPPGTARILLLGGNGPEGLGVSSSQGVARLLEQSADPERGARLEVLNAATGGFGLDNDLNFFRAEGRRYAPDLVLVVLDPTSELSALSPRLVYVSGQSAPAKPTFRLANDALVPTPGPDPSPPAIAVVPPRGLASLQLYRLAMGLPRHVGPALTFTQGEPPPDGTTIDLPAEHARARALARALLSALRDDVVAAGGRLIVVVGPIRAAAYDPEGGPEDQFLRDLAAELHIPAVELVRTFVGAEGSHAKVYLPGSARWAPDGHFVASQAIWTFLRDRRLLPPSVVSVATLGGGRHLRPSEVGSAVRDRLWTERHSTAVQFALIGLLAVAVIWMGCLLPPAAREWLLVAVGVGMIAALGPPRLAPVAVVVLVAWHAAVERLPSRVAVPALVVLGGAIVVPPLLVALPEIAGGARDPRTFFTLATGVAVLRLVAYAVDRRRDRTPPRSLREFLTSVLFFPVLLFGPVESPEADLARRTVGGLAPTSFGDLSRHLGRAAVGLARIGLGGAKLLLATVALNLISNDVWTSAGRAVTRGRLWVWVLELPLYLYALGSGVGDLAIGLAAMAGVGLPETFRAPWAARDAADFWRRWLVPLGDWLRRYVYRPIAAGPWPSLAVAGAFAASTLWLAWLPAVFFRPAMVPGFPAGVIVWGLMNGAAVAAVRRWPGRAAGWSSLAVVLLSWVPFSLPRGIGLSACAGILLRLVGVR